jgi:hypothetical protein
MNWLLTIPVASSIQKVRVENRFAQNLSKTIPEYLRMLFQRIGDWRLVISN